MWEASQARLIVKMILERETLFEQKVIILFSAVQLSTLHHEDLINHVYHCSLQPKCIRLGSSW